MCRLARGDGGNGGKREGKGNGRARKKRRARKARRGAIIPGAAKYADGRVDTYDLDGFGRVRLERTLYPERGVGLVWVPIRVILQSQLVIRGLDLPEASLYGQGERLSCVHGASSTASASRPTGGSSRGS